MNYICINNGYYNTKVCDRQGNINIFDSSVSKAFDNNARETVEIDGVTYEVGKGNKDINLDKTQSITQRACIKYAKQKYGYGCDTIISCMATDTYLNEESRESYKDMLREYCSNPVVYMEGLAAVLNDYEYYQDELVCLVDVGGLTINSMIISNTELVPGTQRSQKLGTIMFRDRIRKYIEQQVGGNVPEYQVPYLEKQYADKVLDEYIQELKTEFRKANYPSNIKYRFIGGGAQDYKEIWQKHFDNAYISNQAIWENVLGLRQLGMIMNGEV